MTSNIINIQIRCTNSACHFHSNFMPWPKNIPLMSCQLCGSDMEIVTSSDNEADWLMKIAEDEDMWVREAEKEFPAVIAYEYRSLREYCRKEEPFAVLLSIKDNFEALLKFEVLLAYAWTAENTGDDFKAKTISLLTTPNLSLGAWLELASVILKDLKKEGFQLPDIIPLDALRRDFIAEEIVNWRNTNIGHGAMSMETDDGFRQDIRNKILLIKEIYSDFASRFRAQMLYLKHDKDAAWNTPLMGADHARSLKDNGKIYFKANGTQLEFCVDPFIIIRKHQTGGYGIYFFDNQRTRNLTHFLAYADGRKASESMAYFEQLRRQLDMGNIRLESTANERNLTPEEIHELDMLQMSHQFIKPRHLFKWLESCLERYEKGVFLLQMNRGMGKSIFTERLSGLAEKPLKVADDIDVRTYHIGTTQAAGVSYFRNEIEELWRNDYEGKTITRMVRISELEKEGKTPAEALCGCLEHILKYTVRNRGKSRLLMVLDGLDEIPGDDLWNFIPNADMLEKGIYFLLTSRDPATEELPEETVSKLDELSVTEKFCPERQGKDNIEFLTEYIDNSGLKGKIGLQDKQKLISLSEYRVLELGMLCRLAENGMEIKDLPDSSKVVSVYLEMLEERYGEKESIRFREILAILCTLGYYEGLTLKTLGYLTGEAGITLRLIGIIRDLAPMLRAERGDKLNLYMITNPALALELKKQIPETEDAVRGIIDLTISVLDDGNYKNGEIDETIVHIVELARDNLPEGMKVLGDDTDDKLMKFFDVYLSKLFPARSIAMNIKLWKQILIFDQERFGQNDTKTLVSELKLSQALCNSYQYNDAIKIAQQTYDKVKTIYDENSPELLVINHSLGNIFNMCGHYKDARYILKNAYEKSIEILGADDYITLSIGNSLYDTLCALGHLEEAKSLSLDLYNKIKKLDVEDNDKLLTSIEQNVILNFQNAMGYEEKLDLAQEEYDELKESLRPDTPETFNSLTKLMSFYYKSGNYEEALNVSQEIYRLAKKYYGDNNPTTIHSLEPVATTLIKLRHFDEAFPLQKKLCEMKERFQGKDHISTLTSKWNLAIVLTELGEYQEAIRLFLEIIEGLVQKSGKDHPMIINIRKGLYSVLNKMCEDQKTLHTYIEVTRKMASILGQDHLETLAAEYDLANFLEYMGYYDKAMIFFQEVYDKRKRLLGEDNLDTISVEYEIAHLLYDQDRFDEALPIGENVYMKRSRLLGEDNEETIIAKELVAQILNIFGRYEEALDKQKDVYERSKRILGAYNDATIISEYLLAVVLYRFERYDEALPYSQEAYENMSKLFGEDCEQTLQFKDLFLQIKSILE